MGVNIFYGGSCGDDGPVGEGDGALWGCDSRVRDELATMTLEESGQMIRWT